MTTGKLAVGALVVALALGGGIAALADNASTTRVRSLDLDDRDGAVLRRDDAGEDIAGVEDDDDKTGDGDRTRGNDGTNGGDNTGDGDNTAGNDGTNGGDNTSVSYDGGSGASRDGGTSN